MRPAVPLVLALHTHALLALFEKTGLIDNQHAIRVGQVLAHVRLQVVPHLISLPDRSSQQMLETVGSRLPGLLSQLPAILALDRTEQSLQISQHLPARLGAEKARSHPFGYFC